MPVTPTYPGIYIEELPSSVRTITGVSTSVTAFIGNARQGPVNKAVSVFSFPEYERTFGGLWEDSALGYAVYQYFLNGGSQAVIVRVFKDKAATDTAAIKFPNTGAKMVLNATSQGSWGSHLLARVDHKTKDGSATSFNLKVKNATTGVIETHLNLSDQPTDSRYVGKVLAADSTLVKLKSITARPAETPAPAAGATEFEDSPDGLAASNAIKATGGGDGDPITDTEILGDGSLDPKTGLHAFDEADIINLLCVPPYKKNNTVLDGDVDTTVRVGALAYAKKRRAIYLVDPDSKWTKNDDPIDAANGVDGAAFGLSRDANAAIYFPHIKSPDPLQAGRLGTFAPSGAIAGLIARTDSQRGVWKAPAGTDASLNGVPELTVKLTDQENGLLNPMGINCLRTFKGVGRVAWGARTMRGSDVLADQWKYLPVRRLALFLEESLYRGSQWVVFEPNDEPLWAQIRLN